jgi:hypothetical protein
MDVPVTQKKSDVPVNPSDKQPGVGPLEQYEQSSLFCEKNAKNEISKLDREADKHILNGDTKLGIKALEESIRLHDQAALATDKVYVNKVCVLAKLLESANPPQVSKAERYWDKASDAMMSHRTVGSDHDALKLIWGLAEREPQTREQMNSHLKRLSKIVELIDRSDEQTRQAEKLGVIQPLALQQLLKKLVTSEYRISAKEQADLDSAFASGFMGIPGGTTGRIPELPRRTMEMVEKLSSRIDDLAGRGPKEEIAEQLEELNKLRRELKKWEEEQKKKPPHHWFKDAERESYPLKSSK